MWRAALTRRDTLLETWPPGMPGVGVMPAVAAGLHSTLRVRGVERERKLIASAAAVGVELSALSSYGLPQSSAPKEEHAGLVIGFAAVPEIKIREATKRLGKIWTGRGAPPSRYL